MAFAKDSSLHRDIATALRELHNALMQRGLCASILQPAVEPADGSLQCIYSTCLLTVQDMTAALKPLVEAGTVRAVPFCERTVPGSGLYLRPP